MLLSYSANNDRVVLRNLIPLHVRAFPSYEFVSGDELFDGLQSLSLSEESTRISQKYQLRVSGLLAINEALFSRLSMASPLLAGKAQNLNVATTSFV